MRLITHTEDNANMGTHFYNTNDNEQMNIKKCAKNGNFCKKHISFRLLLLLNNEDVIATKKNCKKKFKHTKICYLLAGFLKDI